MTPEQLARQLTDTEWFKDNFGGPSLWDATEHSGDCTKQAWSCAVCLREDAIEQCAMMLEALTAAGYAVVPLEADQSVVNAMSKGSVASGHFDFRDAWREGVRAVAQDADR